jgi:putative CocE/NonD family hydrolase
MRSTACIALFLVSALALSSPSLADGSPPLPSVDLRWGVKIPMRDGTLLNATVFSPAGVHAPLPVIFTLTPYIGDTYESRAYYFAQHGYIYALVDVRGRGNSQGRFEPFANEGRDGYDVVEWFAAQPWCNGKVAMWGGSYAGFDQWSTLKEIPPHLATIVPAAAVYPGVDFPFFEDIPISYDVQWLTYTSGVTPNVNLFNESDFWTQKFYSFYKSHRPFADLARYLGVDSASFDLWNAHPTPDAYFDAMEPTNAAYAAMNVPILTITGDYDGDQPGALTYYRLFMRNASSAERARHFLIICPWDHAGTRTPQAQVGGLTFGSASLLDMNDLHKSWYDWTMKRGTKPGFLKKAVAYYVTGSDRWLYADSLDGVTAAHRRLYLSSDGSAGDAFHSGSLLQDIVHGASSDRFTNDPLDLRPGQLEDADNSSNYITDQTFNINLYGAGAIYHSSTLTSTTTLAGFAHLVFYLSADVPDTDLQATLVAILPDGSSIALTSDLVRARYRLSARHQSLLEPGRIERFDLDGFTFFARQLPMGARLRLVISSINSINYEKNYNSGGVVAQETGKDARVAHLTLYHDDAHRSYLDLPIGH